MNEKWSEFGSMGDEHVALCIGSVFTLGVMDSLVGTMYFFNEHQKVPICR